MARIAGVDVPNHKQVRIGLTYIYGIGDSRAAKILAEANVDPFAKIGTLDEDALNRGEADKLLDEFKRETQRLRAQRATDRPNAILRRPRHHLT